MANTCLNFTGFYYRNTGNIIVGVQDWANDNVGRSGYFTISSTVQSIFSGLYNYHVMALLFIPFTLLCYRQLGDVVAAAVSHPDIDAIEADTPRSSAYRIRAHEGAVAGP
jgi:hypothetical protein